MKRNDKRLDVAAVEHAYGNRMRFRMKLRNLLNRFVRLAGRLGAQPISAGTAFLPYPRVMREELGDFAGRTTWYLGRWSRPDRASQSDCVVPSYLDSSIDVRSSEQPVDARTPRHYLIWRITPRTLARALLQPARYTVVDPAFAKGADRDGYLRIEARLPSGSVWSRSEADLRRVDAREGENSTSLVLGTGPSARELVGDHTDWTYRIVCNSAIRDASLMERLRPTHICFGDPVFHVGPSAYAGSFRADLERVVERYDSALVVPGYCAPLLAANLPWAAPLLVPLELVNSAAWTIPGPSHLFVRNTGNVLTQQMVPVAAAISSRIDIAGADGRRPEERYFWSHSAQHQYSDELMRSAFTAHPAFFRDTDYADYYAAHCDAVESLVDYCESLGRTIHAVTTSYIPALASRSVHAGGEAV